MKNRSRQILIIQAALVLVMSGAAAYSLYSFIDWRAFLVFGVLVVIGAAMIVFPKIGILPFALTALLSSIVAILSHSILDIGMATFQGGINNPNKVWGEVEVMTSYPVILAIGLILIAGCIALSLLNSLANDYRSMINGEVEISEIERVIGKNINVSGILIAAGTGISVIFVLVLRSIQPVLAEILADYPWSIPVFGPIAVAILGGFIYWSATRKKPSANE